MRILLVEPYGMRMGHFGLFAAHLGQEFSLQGHEVTVVTGTSLDAEVFLGTERRFGLVEVGLPDPYLSANSLRVSRLTRKLMHGLSTIRISASTFSQALALCARDSIDLVYVMDWEVLSTAALLCWHKFVRRKHLPPLVFHINAPNFSLRTNLRSPLRGLYKLLARAAIRFLLPYFCCALTIQGEWHRTRLKQQLGFHGARGPKFIVVRPGTYLPPGEISRPAARQAFGLDPHATLFLFLGMLRRDKGIEVLLDATSALTGNWQLLIAGAPFDWTPKSLHARVARMGLSERVHTDVRYVPESEVPTYFAAADAVVFPYRGKNYLGNYGPLILACGYGKPVVASDVGEMGALVRGHGLGFAVRSDDPVALCGALNSFLHLPQAERQEMAIRAKRLAEQCSFASIARCLGTLDVAWLRKGG